MRTMMRFLARVWNFAANRRNDERLQEEIEQHIALQTEDNIRAGIPSPEARRQARLKFGALKPVRENYRAEEGLPFLERLLQDNCLISPIMSDSRKVVAWLPDTSELWAFLFFAAGISIPETPQLHNPSLS